MNEPLSYETALELTANDAAQAILKLQGDLLEATNALQVSRAHVFDLQIRHDIAQDTIRTNKATVTTLRLELADALTTGGYQFKNEIKTMSKQIDDLRRDLLQMTTERNHYQSQVKSLKKKIAKAPPEPKRPAVSSLATYLL